MTLKARRGSFWHAYHVESRPKALQKIDLLRSIGFTQFTLERSDV